MNTLIENLNALMTVKKELNKVLVDNEQPGGPVFDTYPEQFRELFRVLEDKIDDVEVGPYDTYQPETVVARPIIGFENNVVTLTCATQGAQIHFRTKDVYGNIQGDSNYVGRFSISRDTYVETYAILNGVRSSQPDNWKWCYYQAGGAVPAPEFDRTNGIVTITCRQQGAQIWWRIMPSTTFVLYTGPELVDGTKWLEAYAVYQGKGSETAISEGTEEGITVADPVLTCSDNVVTITCATEDAVIWYKTNLDDEWTVYTEPIEISVDTEFTAYAYKEGNISNTVTESFEYEEPYVPPVVVPADPVISCSNNVVTITCSTSGATIYYSTDNGVTYNEYTGTITISADTTFYAYSELNGETSNTVSYEAQYEDSPQPVAPADPVISCTNNVVTITCSTSGADIYYSILDDSLPEPVYSLYENPITIDPSTVDNQSVTVYAYSTLNGVNSNISYSIIYVPLDTPVIEINKYGVVTITGGNGYVTFPYYKVNNGNWNKYTNTFTVSDNDVVYSRIVYEENGNYGTQVSETYIYIDYNAEPFTIEALESGSLYWRISSLTSDPKRTIEYKKNNGEWTSITAQEGGNESNRITVAAHDKIQFRGNNATYYNGGASNAYHYFSSNFYCNVYGNIMSLINSTNYSTADELTADYTFYKFFGNGDAGFTLFIVNAENLVLPATTLTDYCYSYMFTKQVNLIKEPAILPATILANKCYQSMFSYCSSLITTPILPATTLAEYCYQNMFYECSSLTTAPELPATTLASNCYRYMFYKCTSLTTAPELPAQTLTNSCYYYMFYKCTNLNYIKCLATNISATDCTYGWVQNVAVSGTFIKAIGMSSWASGSSGIPTNWTIQEASS